MTIAQLQASDPAYSVWVAASAGTGKTTVLTSRVLRLLLSGTNPGKILCLTYTNAGAAEMESRIKAKLGQWVTLAPEKLVSELTKLTGAAPDAKAIKRARKLFLETLDTPDGIKIQTIHSFCQGLMRRFPLEADIVPHFKIMDDKTSRELLKEAGIRMLSDKDKYTHEIAKAVENIFWRVREGTFSEIIKDIISDRGRLNKAINDSDGIEGLKARIFNLLDVHENTNEKEILRHACLDTSFDRNGLHNCATQLLEESGVSFVKRGQIICDWLQKDEAGRNDSFSDYILAFLKEDKEPRKDLLSVKSKILPEALVCEQKRVYDVIKRIKKARVAVLSSSILEISYTLLKVYNQLKASKALLDYDDLIMKAEDLLANANAAPWVLYKLDGGIDHLLLDEAQDTSLEQWNIIDALCADFFSGSGARDVERTVFVVGDEKQSIYSFQGAAPHVFNIMQQKFQKRVEDAGNKWRTVRLDESFRSSPVVLDLVDKIRGKSLEVKGKELKVAPYPLPLTPYPSSSHIAFHKEMYGKIELWPLEEQEKKESQPGWVMPLEYQEKHDVKKILAEKIAVEIAGWLKNGRILKSEGRKVQPGDIMILLRRRKDIADYLISSLKKHKVPVAGIDRLIITQHLAVMDLISLSNFLLLPEDDLSLAEALKSPLINFSEDDLFTVAYGRGKKSLWQSLKESAKVNPKFTNTVEYLSGLLGKVDFLTPFALYGYILEAQDGRKNLIARLGEEINDPVDEFLSLALSYEASHPPSMQGFLSWLLSGESEIKRDMEQAAGGAVRVITVHGSKGLEAPIVILPDTTSEFGVSKSRIFWHEDNIMLWPGSSENMDDICRNIKDAKSEEEKEEYNRLLYVALTRAKSELYIAGWKGRNSIKSGCWYETIESVMAEISQKDENGRLHLSGGMPLANIEDKANNQSAEISLPEYFLNPPAPEPTPTNPLTPSKMEANSNFASNSLASRNKILEGKIIHSLLEFLPDIEAPLRFEAGKKFLTRKFAPIDKATDIDGILHNLINIMNQPSLRDVFGPNSRAEVSIVGMVGDNIVAGRIDRLCVLDEKIIIIDYKTGSMPPQSIDEISSSYIKQMSAYGDILSEIYPKCEIESYLIWTEGAVIHRLPYNKLKYNDKQSLLL